jgi:preprotein translocase subunit Sec61beta
LHPTTFTLMADNKISLPSSGAGITRYFDDFKSKIALKPQVVIVLIALVVLLEIILHMYGNSMFGLG